MGKLVCGDTQMLGGKPHICSSEPGHKTNIHICCCGTIWPAPRQRPPVTTEDEPHIKPN